MGYNQPQVMQQQVPQNKPTAAAVLAILAGVFGLVFAVLAFIGIFYLASFFGVVDVSAFLAIAVAEAIWILVSAILVLVGGVKVRSHPASHTSWGVVILLFSIIGLGLLALSIPDWTGFVGLLIAVMGIIGGILALAFKPAYGPAPYGTQQPYQPQQYQQYPPPPIQQPSAPQQPYQQYSPASQQIKRICPQCGRVVDENLKFCPHCGKQLA